MAIQKLKTINPYDETEIDMDTNSVAGLVYENTPLIQKINELVDAVNELHEEAEDNARIRANHENLIDTLVAENNIHERQIDELQAQVAILEEHAHPTATTKPAENVQDRMIGCTTLDIPKSYKNDQLTLATLDYSKKLEKENSDLKDELDRTRKALEVAVDALREIHLPKQWCPVFAEQEIAKKALDEITALEQKDK